MVRNKKQLKKVALKHILDLFLFSKENFPGDLSKRYIHLIRKYSTRNKVPIPSDIKRSFCKNCNSLLIPGKSCTVRIKSGKSPLRIITCNNCKTIKRLGFKKLK